MLQKGLVQVYTGKTERFNFAPIGLSLRAAGHNLRVLMTCFTAHELIEGAVKASAFLSPNLVIDHSAVEGRDPDGALSEDKILDSFRRTRDTALTAKFDIVILEGIHTILSQEIIPLEDILTLIGEKSSKVELVLTGRGAPKEIIDKAELVTEMVIPPSKDNYGGKNDLGSESSVEVITGDGKGKTTFCVGKACLSSCLGIRSSIFQFIKSPQRYGEVKAIAKFPHLNIKTMGKGFLNTKAAHSSEKHLKAARRAWEVSTKEILSSKHGLVVLDEINVATSYGLVKAEEVRSIITRKPQSAQLLLSGRNAHPRVMEAATTMIEMKEIKHPFRQGIKARKGIEF
jgi:cob(I)alamin adenosyltransferase